MKVSRQDAYFELPYSLPRRIRVESYPGVCTITYNVRHWPLIWRIIKIQLSDDVEVATSGVSSTTRCTVVSRSRN